MVIENTTAAGPSRGILDVLFGSKGAEESADGNEFKPIMDLIKAMNGEGKKDDSGRTDEEIAAGRDLADAQVIMPPVFQPFMPQAVNAESEGEAVVADGNAQKVMPGVLSSAEQIQSEDVNQLLESKGLTKLSAEEQKLLEQVNLKLAAVPLAKAVGDVSGEDPSRSVAGKATVQSDTAMADAEMLKKGKLGKGNEAANPNKAEAVAPFLSTEAFLGLVKEKQNPKVDPTMEQEVPKANDKNGIANQSSNLLKESIKGTEGGSNLSQFSKDFLSDSGKLDGKDRLSGDSLTNAAGFAAALKGEMMTKELHIQTVDPQQIRSALLTEVDQNIQFQALKGGGEMKIVIHPEELGEVKLQVASKNGQIEVKIQAENEAVASIIRSGSKDLEGALKDRDLILTKMEVTVTEGVMAGADAKSSSGDQLFQQSPEQQAGKYLGSSMNNTDRQDSPSWSRPQYDENPRYGSKYEQSNERNRGNASLSNIRERSRDSNGRLDVVA